MFGYSSFYIVTAGIAICCVCVVEVWKRLHDLKYQYGFESCKCAGIGWGPSEKKCKGKMLHFTALKHCCMIGVFILIGVMHCLVASV
jgi:hypothetical protein